MVRYTTVNHPFLLPRRLQKTLGIAACVCSMLGLLFLGHLVGAVFGVLSHDFTTADKDMITAIPVHGHVVTDDTAEISRRYDKDVLQSFKKGDVYKTENQSNTCTSFNYKIVFFIRLPKCASTSLVTILKGLAKKDTLRLTFDPSGAYTWDTPTMLKVASKVKTESDGTKLPYLYARHFYYVNFYDFGFRNFTYVTIVREPVSRFISSFLYYHLSSRPHIQAILKPEHKNESLKTCLDLGHEGCQLNLMTKYFCGNYPVCKEVTYESFSLAKTNIDHHFAVIGITEDMEVTYKLLKHFLPNHFRYLNPKTDSRQQQNKNEHTMDISEELRQEIETKNKFDMLLYYYIRERLYRQAHECDSVL